MTPPIETDPNVLALFRRVEVPAGIDRVLWRGLCADLVRDEGVVLESYRDSLGNRTIGCGHLITGFGCWPEGNRFPAEQLAEVFRADVRRHLDLAKEWIGPAWYRLPLPARQALGNMAFQLGGQLLHDWHATAGRVRRHAWGEVADGLANTRWSRQTPARAGRIIEVFRRLAEEEG